ncbi:unnamed protein product [Arabidopsis arenosa]|uniref:Uncharacterized protein n=1 Tax=Arabidopsis arenosa TaxID=38785 RepID=A0A8S2A3T4_ARAAE|nr:unnamed protein product [Arabidopsis arenosa]
MARVRNALGEYESTATHPRESADTSTVVDPTEETGESREPEDAEPGSETVRMQTDPTEEAAVDASESQPANETVKLERDDAEGQATVDDSNIQLGNESPIEPSTEALETAEEELVDASEEEEENVNAQAEDDAGIKIADKDDEAGEAADDDAGRKDDEAADALKGDDDVENKEAEEDVGKEDEAASKEVDGITADDDSDDGEDQPLPPEKMFLDSSEYTKGWKIGTRCKVTKTVQWIEKDIKEEAPWFRGIPGEP